MALAVLAAKVASLKTQQEKAVVAGLMALIGPAARMVLAVAQGVSRKMVVLVVLAQSVSFTPALLALSHQQIQVISNA